MDGIYDWQLLWSDAPGHVSYVIFAVSYWLTNIFWLRVTAVIGLAFEIAYFRMAGGGGLHVGIGWDVVFILINLWQIYLSGNPASATVMVEDPVHAFVFDLAKLSAMARTDEAIAGDVHRAVGRDLARKLAGA